MWRSLLLASLATASCYQPTIAEGIPCSSEGDQCPSGQRCVDHRCLGNTAGAPDAFRSDGRSDDAPGDLDGGLPDTPDGPPGHLVYASTATELYRVDPATGSSALVGAFTCPGPVTIDDLAVDTAGALVAVDATTLYPINTTTGACGSGVTITGAGPLAGLTFMKVNGNDVLLGITGQTPGKLYLIDRGSGAASDLGSFGGGYFGRGDLTATAGTSLLAIVAQSAAGDSLAAISSTTGNATIRGATLGVAHGLVAVAGDLYSFTATGSIHRLDPASGVVLQTVAGGHPWTGAADSPP